MHKLSMMISITDRGRHASTVTNIACLLQERAGILPFQVSFLGDRDVLVEFERGAPVIKVSRGLYGVGSWGELDEEIGCVMSGKVSLMNMFHEKNERAKQKENFQKQVRDIKVEQEDYQTQLTEVVHALQDKLKVMEQKSQETMVPLPNHFVMPCGVPQINSTGKVEYKVSKPPELPYFSGTDPVPREEGSFVQWIFQVRGLRANHTEDAIRSGIINSVRGEAQDLVEYVGFSAPLEKF